MATMHARTRISQLLDEIWQQRENRLPVAIDLVRGMVRADWLVLAAWDVASRFGPSVGTVSFRDDRQILVVDDSKKPWFTASLESASEDMEKKCAILYLDQSYCVVMNELFYSIPRRQYQHDAGKLLVAMQYARDHIESLLLKPGNMRESEMRSLSGIFGLDVEHFYSLVRWYPVIQELL